MTYIDCNSQPDETLDKLTAVARRIKSDVYGASRTPRVRCNSQHMRIHLVGLRPGARWFAK